jgi:hypothetical protein
LCAGRNGKGAWRAPKTPFGRTLMAAANGM